jgi:uncharacterized protein involved in exopolysaccharide biosynthesis
MTHSARGERAKQSSLGPIEDRGSLIDFLSTILLYRWVVLAVVIPIIAVAGIVAILQERTYTSQSSFISQAQSSTSNISGLASQLGLTLPQGGASENPAFAADLVKSRTILEAAALSEYPVDVNGRAAKKSLLEIYNISGGSSQSRTDRGVKRLVRDVTVSLNQRTGLVSVGVVAPSATLAQAINQRVLDLLNDFNLHNRQSQARTERVFTERRLAEVATDLRAAEDRLEGFLQANRNYRSSPTLNFQYDRLERSVSDQQTLHATLLQAFERAKIDEVRDTPVITVVDVPSLPARPNSRAIVLIKTLFWVMLGLAIGIGLAFVRARLSRQRRHGSAEFRELERLAGELKRELLWPFGRIKRLFVRA